MVYGCGKFSEDAWTALVTAEGESGAGRALAIHLQDCPACRAEFAEFCRLGQGLRKALDGAALAKEAFIASVLSEAAKARTLQQASGTAKTSAPARGAGRAQGAGAPRERASFLGRLASRPAALAVAAALALVVVGASGLFTWRIGPASRSTGYTAPGGVILSLSERPEVLAAGLTTQGVAAAAANFESIPDAAAGTTSQGAGETARAIRAPLGVAAAVAQAHET